MVLVELRAGCPGIADVTEQVDLVRLVEDRGGEETITVSVVMQEMTMM
ncbi:hypothetical protein MMALV_08430 [Candidatus Methanomethylophilus alvi Mx1201]|uniref:Uncharacterized protein n=1 Tax=Methanomethylophilus alvi (strain Mx1201) TaxID=1236689 RepID=M9SB79_METAX|nr:hypothetical protein [Methanomethylophilus alvi]AGI85581.1 hypothetical protein MMALV_08430 [Candidatus Methanomethylophilus alvi Mx1201]